MYSVSVLVIKTPLLHVLLVLTIDQLSVGEMFNDSSSDENQEILCPFQLSFGDGSYVFQFVMHGILLPIVTLFGFICNIISIFIFTRRDMRTAINLILTGKKHFDSLSTKKKL